MDGVPVFFPGIGRYGREWLEQNHEATQSILSKCKGLTPLCQCRTPGVPMYIARRQQYYLARLPLSGPKHAAFCPSYEPDPSLCGRGIYSSVALKDHGDGIVSVKLDVPILIRGSGATPTNVNPIVSGPAREVRDAFKLQGLLHLLWERAGFNRWVPRMYNRRHYRQIYRYLNEAAGSINVRRHTLAKHLFIPEPFQSNEALAIEARRQQAFRERSNGHGGVQQRILVLGQVRSLTIADTSIGLQLSHMPSEVMFWADAKVAAPIRRLAEFAFVEWPHLHRSFKLMVLITIHRTKQGRWLCDQLGCMVTNEQYIPTLTMPEAILAERLLSENRSFYKPLPYDADPQRYPNFLLTDIDITPVPLEIYAKTDEAEAARSARIADYQASRQEYYQWDISEFTHPPTLPAAQRADTRPEPPASDSESGQTAIQYSGAE